MEEKRLAHLLALGPDYRVPIVRVDEHPWKFPGGNNEPGEALGQTAIRELAEETGIHVEKVHYLSHELGSEKSNFLFGGLVENFDTMKDRGNDGEEVRLLLIEDLLTLPDFYELHRRLLMNADAVVAYLNLRKKCA